MAAMRRGTNDDGSTGADRVLAAGLAAPDDPARALLALALIWGEYLANIDLGRGTAQKRVTGGRWRRIVLGDVLAGQAVELGGSPRLWP